MTVDVPRVSSSSDRAPSASICLEGARYHANAVNATPQAWRARGNLVVVRACNGAVRETFAANACGGVASASSRSTRCCSVSSCSSIAALCAFVAGVKTQRAIARSYLSSSESAALCQALRDEPTARFRIATARSVNA